MVRVQRWLAIGGLVGADVLALVLLTPRWAVLGHDLAAPHDWVARVGADHAVAVLGAAALWCVALWLAIGLAAAYAGVLPGVCGRIGRRVADRVLPAAVGRLVAGAAGLSVLAAPVAAAASTVPPSAPARADTATSASAPAPRWPTDGAPLPRLQIGWPTSPQPAPAAPPPAQPAAPPPQPAVPATPSAATTGGSVVVHPGDSLWVIAARRLGPAATPSEIAAAWPKWYRANRGEIGPDPGLIYPGQVLHAPAGATAHHQHAAHPHEGGDPR